MSATDASLEFRGSLLHLMGRRDCNSDSLAQRKLGGFASSLGKRQFKLLPCSSPVLQGFGGKKTFPRKTRSRARWRLTLCVSQVLREKSKGYTSSGGVFSYAVRSFRGTTCFLVFRGTGPLTMKHFACILPSSLPPSGVHPSVPGTWLQRRGCHKLAQGPVLSLLSAGASIRTTPLLPPVGNAGGGIGS